jgi:hypothetical protein
MTLLQGASAQGAYVCFSADQEDWVCHSTPGDRPAEWARQLGTGGPAR